MADNKQFGGWYNNPSQGNKNMRYWGGDVWSNGEDPTGGKGVNWQQTQTPQTSSSTSPTDYATQYSAMADRLAGQFNLDPLQKTAQGLQTAQTALPGNVTANAQALGSSQSQRDLMFGRESEKLAPTVQTATQNYQNAIDAYNSRLGIESTGMQQAEQAKEFQQTQAAEAAKGTVEELGNSKYLVNPTTGEKKYLGPATGVGTTSTDLSSTFNYGPNNGMQSTSNLPSTSTNISTPKPNYSSPAGTIRGSWYSTGNGWAPTYK